MDIINGTKTVHGEMCYIEFENGRTYYCDSKESMLELMSIFATYSKARELFSQLGREDASPLAVVKEFCRARNIDVAMLYYRDVVDKVLVDFDSDYLRRFSIDERMKENMARYLLLEDSRNMDIYKNHSFAVENFLDSLDKD